MGVLRNIWDWLTSSGRTRRGDRHIELYELNVGQLARDFDLERKATELGTSGMPAPTAVELSGPESTIIQHVDRARHDFVEWGSRRVGVLKAEIARCDVTASVNRARQADAEFARRASSEIAEQETLVRKLRLRAMDESKQLKHFQQRHALDRDARVPTRSKVFLTYALVSLLVIVEAAANAFFFAQGVDFGLIGGFVYAALFAVINVVVAFLLGKYLVGFVFHHKLWGKLIGLVGSVLAIVAMVSVALLIAHMRDAIGLGGDEPAKLALATLKSATFELRDVNSWFLMAVSIFFALIALFDGLYSNDLYPGYGRRFASAEEAVDEYREELDALRGQLADLKTQALGDLESNVEASRVAIVRLDERINEKRTAELRLSGAILSATRAMDALLHVFRSHNERHRDGAPVPAYFNTTPTLETLRLPDFDLESDGEFLRTQQAQLVVLLSEVEPLRARIQAAFNRQLDSFKPLGEHFPDGEHMQ